MNAQRARGFTLIELLTVIAIIAILAAFVAVAAPRALEAAKKRRMVNALNQLRTQLTSYYTTSNPYSYPPAYGFLSRNVLGMDPLDVAALPDIAKFHLRPYLSALELYTTDVYDEFSETYDTDLPPDNRMDLLEFSPIPTQDVSTGRLSFPAERYDGDNLPGQVQQMVEAEERPFVYLPYNTSQYKIVRQYWIKSNDFQARTWDPNSAMGQQFLSQITFPPTSYDAFVLIGVGPGRSSFGLLKPPAGDVTPDTAYHVAALRAVFLALRDLNQNQALDFDFEARRTGEAALTYTVDTGLAQVPANNDLPDTRAPRGFGPWIYTSPKGS